jgi:predicted DNA-binding protein (MmcQ/YjbR family)
MTLPSRTEALKASLEALPGAEASAKSPPGVVIYKVMEKMFAILSVRGAEGVILKADPHLVEILRETYTGVGHRSHLDRRFWIHVRLDADVPPEEIERLAAGSYALVCAGLTKAQKAALAALG